MMKDSECGRASGRVAKVDKLNDVQNLRSPCQNARCRRGIDTGLGKEGASDL
jgi:hypothetical protein